MNGDMGPRRMIAVRGTSANMSMGGRLTSHPAGGGGAAPLQLPQLFWQLPQLFWQLLQPVWQLPQLLPQLLQPFWQLLHALPQLLLLFLWPVQFSSLRALRPPRKRLCQCCDPGRVHQVRRNVTHALRCLAKALWNVWRRAHAVLLATAARKCMIGGQASGAKRQAAGHLRCGRLKQGAVAHSVVLLSCQAALGPSCSSSSKELQEHLLAAAQPCTQNRMACSCQCHGSVQSCHTAVKVMKHAAALWPGNKVWRQPTL